MDHFLLEREKVESPSAGLTSIPPFGISESWRITSGQKLQVVIAFHHHHHHLALQTFVGFRLLSQVFPSSSVLSCLLPVFYFQFFRSSMTSSCHRCLGLPIGLFPIGLQSNSFPVGLARSIRWICPSHLILCALMNLIIFAPSIDLSISMLFRILHILSIFTGSYINFINSNQNSPVLQRMLEILSCRPNAFSTFVENVVLN